MYPILGGILLGWALGANDLSNVFGTAVAARIVTFRRAALLFAVAVIAGAVLQGAAGFHTMSSLSRQDTVTLLITSLAAALTIGIMIALKLPVSAVQAVVGAVSGIGLATGTINWTGLEKVAICWVATPLGALLVAVVVYRISAAFFARVPMGLFTRDQLLAGGLLLVGVYGAYALGANGAAVATGIFSGVFPALDNTRLAFIGGLAIALGGIFSGQRMIRVVGRDLMVLDGFTALVAVLSMSVTVHVFALIGVPVSGRQAIVGAMVGLAFMRGLQTIRLDVLRTIGVGWFLTPVIALVLAAAGYAVVVGSGYGASLP
jgi:PiT family inorganic phosphate transporter